MTEPDPLKRFVLFHVDNRRIWEMFQVFTSELLARGFQRYSATAVINRIRWEVDVDTFDYSDFKIDNNYTAYFARMWLATHQNHNGFFATRARPSTDEYSEELLAYVLWGLARTRDEEPE